MARIKTNQTIQIPATPAYEISKAETASEKLTWLIELNANEGADADLAPRSP